MKRFLTIQNNKIICDRWYNEIAVGEIEDDGTYGEVGMILLDGVWQVDPQEILESQKQSRISELKTLIGNLKLLDMDCATEQAELKQLLGL